MPVLVSVMPRPVCRFEYLYRDASNYKGYGAVLLWGEATAENEAAIRAVCCRSCGGSCDVS